MSMPERNGDWMFLRSAVEAAPQRTASRKASSRSGGSKPVGSGRGDLLDDLGARLDLPDDLKLFAEGVVLDGEQRDEMLRLSVEGLERAFVQSALGDLADDPLPLADVHELPLFRGTSDSGGHKTLTAQRFLAAEGDLRGTASLWLKSNDK